MQVYGENCAGFDTRSGCLSYTFNDDTANKITRIKYWNGNPKPGCYARITVQASTNLISNSPKVCVFRGDPHFTETFFHEPFDSTGIGIFKVAKANHAGGLDVEVQDMQCPTTRGKNNVAIGVAVKICNKNFFCQQK
jgi:hypothetical protein